MNTLQTIKDPGFYRTFVLIFASRRFLKDEENDDFADYLDEVPDADVRDFTTAYLVRQFRQLKEVTK
jgi:hypothetical protein